MGIRRLRAGGDRQILRLDGSAAQPERQPIRAPSIVSAAAPSVSALPHAVFAICGARTRGANATRALEGGSPASRLSNAARAPSVWDAPGRHDHRAAALRRAWRRGRARHRREPQLAALHGHRHPPADQRPDLLRGHRRSGELRHQLAAATAIAGTAVSRSKTTSASAGMNASGSTATGAFGGAGLSSPRSSRNAQRPRSPGARRRARLRPAASSRRGYPPRSPATRPSARRRQREARLGDDDRGRRARLSPALAAVRRHADAREQQAGERLAEQRLDLGVQERHPGRADPERVGGEVQAAFDDARRRAGPRGSRGRRAGRGRSRP